MDAMLKGTGMFLPQRKKTEPSVLYKTWELCEEDATGQLAGSATGGPIRRPSTCRRKTTVRVLESQKLARKPQAPGTTDEIQKVYEFVWGEKNYSFSCTNL